MYSVGEQGVFGHGVERLASRAAQHDREFDRLRERIAILDTYYVPTRYPNSLPDGIPALAYNREVAEQAVRLAVEATDFVAERLPQ